MLLVHIQIDTPLRHDPISNVSKGEFVILLRGLTYLYFDSEMLL